MNKNHQKSVVNYFTTSAEYYDNVYYENADKKFFRASEMQWRKNAVFQILDSHSRNCPLKILDLGCGAGYYLKSALERGHDAFGLDITFEMVSKACMINEGQFKNGKPLILGDIDFLPFPNDTFDVILCIGVLQYLHTERTAIKEMTRVLKNSGIAIATAPNLFKISNIFDPYYYLILAPKYIWSKIRRKLKKQYPGNKLDFSLNTDFSNKRYYYGQLDKEFKDSNLNKVRVTNIGFGPFTIFRKEIIPLAWSENISRFFTRLANQRLFRILGFFANRWVLCFKKDFL